eukprot:211811_1
MSCEFYHPYIYQFGGQSDIGDVDFIQKCQVVNIDDTTSILNGEECKVVIGSLKYARSYFYSAVSADNSYFILYGGINKAKKSIEVFYPFTETILTLTNTDTALNSDMHPIIWNDYLIVSPPTKK